MIRWLNKVLGKTATEWKRFRRRLIIFGPLVILLIFFCWGSIVPAVGKLWELFVPKVSVLICYAYIAIVFYLIGKGVGENNKEEEDE